MDDGIGNRVAVSGDTVVVGAAFEDSSTTGVGGTPNELAAEAGAAYVFVRSGSTWTQQAYIKARNAQAADYFGFDVAVSGGTVVVGADSEDSSTMGVNTRYRLDNRWYADKGVMLFNVVPEGSGPISTGDGWWRVSTWGASQSLLEYSVDMAMQWWVPSMLERKAAGRLPTVVRVTKRRAETASAATRRSSGGP